MTDNKKGISMKAGPELNLRIAREVMEEDVPDGYERVGDHWEKEEPIFEDAKFRCWQIVKWPLDYSGNIAAAWRAVERFRQGGGRIGPAAYIRIEIFDDCRPKDIACGIYSPAIAGVEVFAETAPLAICLAALKAIGIQAEG